MKKLQKGDSVIFTPKKRFDPCHGCPIFVGKVIEYVANWDMYIVDFLNGSGTDTIHSNLLKRISKETADLLQG